MGLSHENAAATLSPFRPPDLPAMPAPPSSPFSRLPVTFSLLGLALLFLSGSFIRGEEQTATAGSDFPARPIRIVVYTGPGGLIDFTSRKFAEVARKYAPEQPIVVINKPGGGGIVAFEEVLRSPADGYSILAVTRSNITKLVSTGREELIDGVDWFAHLMDNPHVAITNTESGLTTWDQVVADSQAREGRQIWLGVAIGGVKHVSAVRLWEKSGLGARWIPYSSGGQASAALLGEIGQVYFGNPSDAARNPALKIVGVCATGRMDAFPDAPTFAEMGIPDLEGELIWRGFAFRKGTPAPVLEWYESLVRKVSADPEWRDQWESEGINVTHRSQKEFTELVERDRALFREVLEPIGLLKKPNTEKWLGFIETEKGVRLANILLLILFAIGAFRLALSSRRHAMGETLVAAAALLIAASLLLMTSLLPKPSLIDTVGSAGVPRLWAVALLILAILQVVLSLRGEEREHVPFPGPGEILRQHYVLPGFLIMVTLYLLIIPIAGYYLGTLLFLPITFWLLGFRRPLPTAIITILWLAFTYFIFQRMLYVDLPLGKITGLIR